MRIILLILLGTVRASHDYFEYEDCGHTCTVQKSCCTIKEDNGNFITKCCNSEECEAKESNIVVCLRPNEAPIGGSDIWPEFRRTVHPSTSTTTPAPEVNKDCRTWKAVSGVSWSLLGIVVIILTVIFVLRWSRSRNVYSQVINPDNPYRETVQNNDSMDNQTEREREDVGNIDF